MFMAERFLSNLWEGYGKHSVSTDGEILYPQAWKFLKLDIILIPLMGKAL